MSDQSEESAPVIFETKIPNLKKKYHFHELVRESPFAKHYIVEDLEIEIVENQA
jgi:hypothetical protein